MIKLKHINILLRSVVWLSAFCVARSGSCIIVAPSAVPLIVRVVNTSTAIKITLHEVYRSTNSYIRSDTHVGNITTIAADFLTTPLVAERDNFGSI